ncbi:hypothetical protein [Novosphingobium mangrovi (ex Huang et al. 2023)]|uniref:Transporter n=1 Tax=Novosphingobium mangrovi (ex Huang et al. 2023) TaxID=2976432 RepID=A0ABT2I0Z4_9SPHN|nr:hypothetical protein [Novosphingobium mangrovi (ex Huang et al. 2023)]MCT2398470.1 hypothetical protein [Novosphingobium mangrovi (ex Huang et al. 2023)]
MTTVALTAGHWTFAAVVVAIVLAFLFRRGVTILAILGIMAVAAQSGNAGGGLLNHSIFAVQGVFRAMLLAGTELFDVILLIAVMLALLRSLQTQGVNQLIMAPLRATMKGPRSSFLSLAIITYVTSAFFWPSPAIALIGAVLLPAAGRAGLSAISAAVALNLAGHGMALSADPVLQAATRITAGAATEPVQSIFPYTLLFSLIVGGVALGLGAIPVLRGEHADHVPAESASSFNGLQEAPTERSRHALLLAILVPAVLFTVTLTLAWRDLADPARAIFGADATAFLGGTGLALLIISCALDDGHRALETVVEHLTTGVAFAVSVFAPVLPIYSFFLLGDTEHARQILGPGTPGYMLDLGSMLGTQMGHGTVPLVVGIVVAGALCGIDGTGFAGLPIVGALSATVAPDAPEHVAVLAAIGQISTIWVGSGTLIPWSSVCVVAGICGVSPEALVRRNLVPVLGGLGAAMVVAILLLN